MGKKVFVDLTHPFSADIPRWPYFVKPVIDSMHSLAKGGVLTQRIDCVQHTGTHCDAPRHVMEYEFDGRLPKIHLPICNDELYGRFEILKRS